MRGSVLLSKIVDNAYVITLFKVEGVFVVSAVNRRESDPFFFESFEAQPDVLDIKGVPFDFNKAIIEYNESD